MPITADRRLLAGFRFRCLPGCGLCCYTTPAVRASERAALIQLDPTAPLLDTSDGWAQIASRPEGGACHFLSQEQCRCHSVRPATCAEFPITVYLGVRAQFSVVLSCPGVDLAPLRRRLRGNFPDEISPDLSAELSVAESELHQAEAVGQARWAAQRRAGVERRLRRKGVWQSEEEVRTVLKDRLPDLIPRTLAAGEEVGDSAPLESLPLFYDVALGRVAWRSHPGGVEFLTLREAGGIAAHLEVLPLPEVSPALESPARSLLQGYLEYLLDRDSTMGAAYQLLLDDPSHPPEEIVADDLGEAAEQVLCMSILRRALTSDRRGELTAGDVEQGIRATDMDRLDRPTIGVRW